MRITYNKLPKMEPSVRRAVSRVVRRTKDTVELDIKEEIMHGTKSGRLYPRGKNVPPHQASAPGEAPATDLGDLVGSIDSRMLGDLAAEVNIHSEHGPPLEFGTANGNLAPRPFVAPAVEANREPFREDVARAVKDGLEGA
jgi:hypothetical protein